MLVQLLNTLNISVLYATNHMKNGHRKMPNLPQERCTEAAPFTYGGLHMFGPLIIRERRSKLKRYGAPVFPVVLSTLK